MDPSLEALSDEELAILSQAGSLGAFEQLVYRYEARVLAFLARCCHNQQVAREVTQDTFVRAFQALAQYQATKAFAPWLFTIARRKCIDHYRAFPLRADLQPPELTHDDDPAELLVRDEARDQLWRLAREHLPPNQHQALWLRYVEELNLAQIATVMGKTKTGIKVLLFRARQTLGRLVVGIDANNCSPAAPARPAPHLAPKAGSAVSLNAPRPSLILNIEPL